MNPTQAGSFTTPVSNALKATIQHHDSAVIIHARGEIDAPMSTLGKIWSRRRPRPPPRRNHSWSTSTASISWAAAQSPSLLTRPNGVDAGAWTCAW
ncbi:anti-anti-sigma factor RsfA [Mycobacterium tuberculosis]|nr:anti-anti-sigma factor RsfA [Mycobacterium tuberculosis]CKV65159.1 anti-anti-sigma factor RsfA [Mycobacterium tuberculosis]